MGKTETKKRSTLRHSLSNWAVVVCAFSPALGRQRQAGFCEFEASVGYTVSSSTGSKATQKKTCLEQQQQKDMLCQNAVFMCAYLHKMEILSYLKSLVTFENYMKILLNSYKNIILHRFKKKVLPMVPSIREY